MRYSLVSMCVLAIVGFGVISLLSTASHTADARAQAEKAQADLATVQVKFEPTDAITQALAKPITAEFANAPLSEVLAFIADRMGVNVNVETRMFDNASVDLKEARVTLSLKNVPASRVLRSALDQVGDPTQLGFASVDDVLTVSTTERIVLLTAETRVYNVRDLTALTGPAQPLERDLTGLIETTVDPASWAEQGGISGTISLFNGLLTINTSRANHEMIEKLLTSLRTAADAKPGSPAVRVR